MKITIAINTDHPGMRDDPEAQVARVLEGIAQHLRSGGKLAPQNAEILRDARGTRVGLIQVQV